MKLRATSCVPINGKGYWFDTLTRSGGGQLAARGPHLASHSVVSGPRKYSGKILKCEYSSNLSQ